MPKQRRISNIGILKIALIIVILMLLLSFASSPLYNLFCKTTGYGGTLKKVKYFQFNDLGSKSISVQFNADLDPTLPIIFKNEQHSVKIKTGENILVFYSLENFSQEDLNLIAVYNVTPHKTAKYFSKVACFCFEKITIQAKETLILPVSFQIDKRIETDKNTKNISDLTLSYSIFRYE